MELAHTSEYGLLVADAELVRQAARDHLASSDAVVGLSKLTLGMPLNPKQRR